MRRLRRWWVNADYDRDHMRRFYETHPNWSDLPPEVVANTLTFQGFAVGEAGRKSDRKNTATRVKRQYIEAEADASRDDATQTEKAMPELYASVQNVLRAIETLSST